MKKAKPNKRCLNCEVEFAPKGYRVQKFCSNQCSKKFSAHGRVPLKEWTPRPKPAPNKTTQTVANAVVKGLKDGKGVRQLAVEFSLSGGTIRRIRKDAAIEYVFKNRKCLYCEELIPDTGRMDRRFCDLRCSRRYSRNLPVNCIECGTKLAKRRIKYCSLECGTKKLKSDNPQMGGWDDAGERLTSRYRTKRNGKPGTERLSDRRRYETITISCPECGTEFQKIHIEGQVSPEGVTSKKYCSGSCTINATKKRKIRKNNKLNAKRKHIKSCAICGEEFSTLKPMGCWGKNKDMQEPRPHPQMKYCSVKCRDEKGRDLAIKKHRKGVKELSDDYVKSLLRMERGTNAIKYIENIPQFLIEMKREELLFTRKVRKIRKND
jgi:hypothetical protein